MAREDPSLGEEREERIANELLLKLGLRVWLRTRAASLLVYQRTWNV
jgi:hypothetical protein